MPASRKASGALIASGAVCVITRVITPHRDRVIATHGRRRGVVEGALPGRPWVVMGRLPRFEPMLASTGAIPADSAGVAIEPKFGFRCVLYLNDPAGPRLRAYSRSGRPLGDSVPELAPLAAAVGTDAVLDGELIVTDEAGHPDFYALSRRMLATPASPLAHLRPRARVTFVAFDVLWLDGTPLVARPYTERRSRLEELALTGSCWTTTPSYWGIAVEDMLAACSALGLEGLVVKGASSKRASLGSSCYRRRCGGSSRSTSTSPTTTTRFSAGHCVGCRAATSAAPARRGSAACTCDDGTRRASPSSQRSANDRRPNGAPDGSRSAGSLIAVDHAKHCGSAPST